MTPENTVQPLDTLMNLLGISNAQLVSASTEQLSFKNVQKGRTGKRLTPNIQDKILTALLKVKPDLKIRRRDLFRYDMEPKAIKQIDRALAQAAKKKIRYPKFVDLLVEAGVNRYAVDVVKGTITFYGAGGEAHVVDTPLKVEGASGLGDEAALASAISDAQKDLIDHPTFLKRIYAAGIESYEAHLTDRVIRYRGPKIYRKEVIPPSDAPPVQAPPKAEPAAKPAAKKDASVKPKKKKPGIIRTTRKARLRLRREARNKKRRPPRRRK